MQRVAVSREIDVGAEELRQAITDVEAFLRAAGFDQATIDGIFETMDTWYAPEETPAGTTVTATTEFGMDASIVGPILDATIIKRQRRRELTAQFEYLEALAED